MQFIKALLWIAASLLGNLVTSAQANGCYGGGYTWTDLGVNVSTVCTGPRTQK